jgi:dTMP kinase
VFVTFEGLDGCGKSTQAALLAATLRQRGREVVATREPGGTPLGERVRELLLDGAEMGAWAEAALFAAARAELVETVIRPALARGAAVVCDRFLDSSLAYQGVARGLGVERVLALNEPVLGGVVPDRTIVLAVPVSVGLARRAVLRGREDRIEGEGLAFATEVERGYREVAARFPERIAVVDGTRPVQEVAARVRALLGLVQ